MLEPEYLNYMPGATKLTAPELFNIFHSVKLYSASISLCYTHIYICVCVYIKYFWNICVNSLKLIHWAFSHGYVLKFGLCKITLTKLRSLFLILVQ